jgi:hypothetical protein
MKVLNECGPWRREPPRIVLKGRCPRCKDPDGIDEWIPEEVSPVLLDRAIDQISEVDLAADTPQEYVRCQCHVDHDATKENKGCGAQGLVPVVVVS